ncbi:MAG: hypothetical protein A2504_14690 [Bdellovibrionales bacterium RIFOXYD12_FULL_39_22]|nr:MAG: hypothetical protein A2385_10155 [Bdellovibrionales bacterium RIFOXYB1_FULL_39_21]OFZ40826.1 MAG: hypothetical protein A2485_17315 [Bdellovibrionales bacterium RIFOXYC12_FULL_39_17]OFZ44367.1 MAG: hypothetical protein A2404_10925 [Bdellovibrionales bacterium RIFOXYC1_FULL_39_130]OFZ73921.1 MAG: hypothetical protein A2451_02525 [Bdellovibrionales bacterium RIFOXYC2_FULL_39_8]OFZ74114.1 MAG: hypothetical protein A2560_03590 [Bdellovibrionales bacterium RIFOXYD1_FULL_39_84]OFZ91963.1 MAG:
MIREINIPQITSEEISAIAVNFPKGIIFLDLETTGLSPLMDKIIEISAIKVRSDKIEKFDSLIDPKISILPASTKIHGINDEMVHGRPMIDDILGNFMAFVENLPIVAHNARFDLGFIVFNLHRLKMAMPNNEVYCSCKFARKAFPQLKKFNLAFLIESLNVHIDNHHRALDDAIAAAHVFAKGLVYLNRGSNREKTAILKDSFLFRLDEFNKKTDYSVPEHLEILKEKVNLQEEIEIIYSGGSHRNKFRPIKPVSILPMPAGNVLYAKCLLSDQYKSFALSKISEVRNIPPK